MTQPDKTLLEELDEIATDHVKPITREVANAGRNAARVLTFGLLDDMEDSDEESSWW